MENGWKKTEKLKQLVKNLHAHDSTRAEGQYDPNGCVNLLRALTDRSTIDSC